MLHLQDEEPFNVTLTWLCDATLPCCIRSVVCYVCIDFALVNLKRMKLLSGLKFVSQYFHVSEVRFSGLFILIHRSLKSILTKCVA